MRASTIRFLCTCNRLSDPSATSAAICQWRNGLGARNYRCRSVHSWPMSRCTSCATRSASSSDNAMNSNSSSFANPVAIGALRGYAASRSKRIRKRLLDLALTVPLLMLCAPLWLMIVLWIRTTSDGPALYRQQRVGVRGTLFTLFKFRSMIAAPDSVHREYVQRWIRQGESARQAGGEFKLATDARITSAGAFLRKYSLDELPQLLNVLRGEMSLVGPRPALYNQTALTEMRQNAGVLRFLPGITGWAQVNGRDELADDVKVEADKWYCDHWSYWLDWQIIFSTFGAVLSKRGAN